MGPPCDSLKAAKGPSAHSTSKPSPSQKNCFARSMSSTPGERTTWSPVCDLSLGGCHFDSVRMTNRRDDLSQLTARCSGIRRRARLAVPGRDRHRRRSLPLLAMTSSRIARDTTRGRRQSLRARRKGVGAMARGGPLSLLRGCGRFPGRLPDARRGRPAGVWPHVAFAYVTSTKEERPLAQGFRRTMTHSRPLAWVKRQEGCW